MKNKVIVLLLLLFFISGCSNSEEPETNETTNTNTETNPTDPEQTEDTSDNNTNQKVLVAYFSKVGNTDYDEDVDASSSASVIREGDTLVGSTEYIANIIVEETGGDKYLIETVEKYPAGYDETLESGEEEKAADERPELRNPITNFEEYDVIYLGFPNWWYGMPMAVHTFLESYDFNDKIIIPFNTSGGSGFSNAISEMEDMYPNADIKEGYTTSGSTVTEQDSEIIEWITSNQ